MSLPKLDTPLFTIKQPSTNKKITLRTLTVKEEKILLLAQEADNLKTTLFAIKQVINNCVQDKDFNVNALTIFDVEYIFLQLRARSIDNKATISYKDQEDNKVYSFEIDLDKVSVDIPKKTNFKVKISEDKTLLLKYPTVEMFDHLSDSSTEEEQNQALSISVLDKLYLGDEVFEISEYTKEEVIEFIESFSLPVFVKIKTFIDTLPSLSHTLTYTNANGATKQIVLRGIDDFFI